MAPKVDPKVLKAVAFVVVDGMEVLAALKKARCKSSEQNLRKHIRKRRRSAAAADDVDDKTLAPCFSPAGRVGQVLQSKSTGRRTFIKAKRPVKRRSSLQVTQAHQAKEAERRAYSAALKAATTLYAAGRKEGSVVTAQEVSDQIFEATGGEADGGVRVHGRSIRNYYNGGLVGKSPLRMGRVPKAAPLHDVMESFAQLCQLEGTELKPKELARRARVAAAANGIELNTTNGQILQSFRIAKPHIQSAGGKGIEEARWQWNTYTNHNDWFGTETTGWKGALLRYGFASNEPDGDSEVTIPPPMRRRILNIDETQVPFDNSKDRKGPRGVVMVDMSLPRLGSRTAKSSSHTSQFLAISAGGGAVSAYMFDTSAAHVGNRRIKLSWIEGLPKTRGQFGFEKEREMPAVVMVTESGGTDSVSFEAFLNKAIIPLYPDLSQENPILIKTDMGPGRMNWEMRERMWAKGVILFPGLQNATGSGQECDALFGDGYKEGCMDCLEEIMVERITEIANSDTPEQQARVTRDDTGRIVGPPFRRFMTKEKVIKAWEKVGGVPLTRACCSADNVRHEDMEGDPTAGRIQEVKERHQKGVEAVSKTGMQGNAFAKQLTQKRRKKRKGTRQSRFEELVERGNINPSSSWYTVGAEALNCDEMMAAHAKIVEKEVAKEQARHSLISFLNLTNNFTCVTSTLI